ncbi:protein [Scardovia inopinata]|uniref:DUF881 domain-containing protein n=1 Tax=Scardovia inopinata F0304 TaxID=641146 RepID=W5IJG0_SCAIO|nr:DUF881 domain-containing protein [Scardovia inopinata]EFG27161.1 hypothetical protein HMPREF9020_00800 [Scardovia inopinata F0304]BAR06773.1 conserved hypothetical protein [Scardovia inopinata JCM 12537]SUV50836.1 protein [Scardovia inopinata]
MADHKRSSNKKTSASQQKASSQTASADESSFDEEEQTTGAFPVIPRKKRKRIPHVSGVTRNKALASILIFVLCLALGFGYMWQRHNTPNSYSNLSEDELVRLLDETNTQISKLEAQRNTLTSQLNAIQRAANKQDEINRIAKENEETNGILSGRLPAEGKGILITIRQGKTRITSAILFSLLEELRNAGAEVIDFDGVRIVTSSYIVDTEEGLECDGILIRSPFLIKAIGNPSSLENAVDIAGGVGSKLRVQYGATVKVKQSDKVIITSKAQKKTNKYAKTVE